MTKLLVLGLLDDGPKSGYDIQQKLSEADAERWGGVLVGSIYHALKKLEQEKYIKLAGVEQTGHRQKAVYQITEQGRIYLQSLIQESLSSVSALYPTTLYSGLSLLEKIPREAAFHALEMQKQLLEKEYQALKQGELQNEQEQQEIPPLSKITIENMFLILQQQQLFVEKILEILEDKT
ncbi:MAG: PadR family transcriptional regulator [Lachnospiraceae bacterium]|nr:PadR family transcriptional regulator [Lachnospiraceae bacterium]